VSLPGLALETAQKVVQSAHQICPYSVATRGNIEVVLNIV
jgi:organic hydroperoxide reductase OsmC/OhrA